MYEYLIKYGVMNSEGEVGIAVVNANSPKEASDILQRNGKFNELGYSIYNIIQGEEVNCTCNPNTIITEVNTEKGPKGDRGEKGEKGDSFKFSDFTEQELELLKGPKGDQGIQGIQGIKGDTGPQGLIGPKGDPLRFSDLTDEEKESIRGEKGPQGLQGIPGRDGQDGYTPIKGVDYFDGKDGANGKDGKDGKNGTNGIDGINGEDGYSPIVEMSKTNDTTTIQITDKNGTKTSTIKDGKTGDSGVYVGSIAPTNNDINVWLDPTDTQETVLEDAPKDGNSYVRKDGEWLSKYGIEIKSGVSGFYTNYISITSQAGGQALVNQQSYVLSAKKGETYSIVGGTTTTYIVLVKYASGWSYNSTHYFPACSKHLYTLRADEFLSVPIEDDCYICYASSIKKIFKSDAPDLYKEALIHNNIKHEYTNDNVLYGTYKQISLPMGSRDYVRCVSPFTGTGNTLLNHQGITAGGFLIIQNTNNTDSLIIGQQPYTDTVIVVPGKSIILHVSEIGFTYKILSIGAFEGSKVKDVTTLTCPYYYNISRFFCDSYITNLTINSWDKVTTNTDCFLRCYLLENVIVNGNLSKINWSFAQSLRLTYESLVSIINSLPQLDEGETHTLTLHSTAKAKLTDEDKQLATSKGWTIA